LICYLYENEQLRHTLVLEKILPLDNKVRYPICISGKRACPPENCGGIYGYAELLEKIADLTAEEHEEITKWLGRPFEPEKFSPDYVNAWFDEI